MSVCCWIQSQKSLEWTSTDLKCLLSANSAIAAGSRISFLWITSSLLGWDLPSCGFNSVVEVELVGVKQLFVMHCFQPSLLLAASPPASVSLSSYFFLLLWAGQPGVRHMCRVFPGQLGPLLVSAETSSSPKRGCFQSVPFTSCVAAEPVVKFFFFFKWPIF